MKKHTKTVLLMSFMLVLGAVAFAEQDVMVVFGQVPPGSTITYITDGGEEIMEEIVPGKEYPASGRVVFATRGILTVRVLGNDQAARVMGQPNANFDLIGSSILDGIVINPGPGPNLLVQSGGGNPAYVSPSTGSDDGNPINRDPGIVTQAPAPVGLSLVRRPGAASVPEEGGPAATYREPQGEGPVQNRPSPK